MLEIQKKFYEKHDLGFSLLSDPDHKIAEAFGVGMRKRFTVKPLWESFVRLF